MMYKKARHYYWLLTGFVKKHIGLLAVSFIGAFLVIVFSLNFFPLFNSIIFSKTHKIGLIGTYTLQNIPDEVAGQISNPLITINKDGEIQPLLANSYEISEDGRTYRFHLRNDLFWTDNSRFTAHDIHYTFQDVQVVPVDDFTLDFRLKEPLNIFPIYLTQPVIKPPLTGVGPLYTVEDFSHKKNILYSIDLAPNKPDLPYKVYRFYNSEEDLINAYKKGEITEFKTSNRNVVDVFDDWNNTDIKRAVNPDEIMTLFINTESGMLQERDVRKALAFAIPAFTEEGEPARSPIPPTSWAYFEDTREYPYNEERARGLLENYVTASESAKLRLFTFYDHIDTAETVKSSLENVGLEIDLKIISSIPQDYDLFLTVWKPPSDPDQYFFWHSTQDLTNITNLKNVKVDKLLEDGRRFLNIKQRAARYQEFQETIAEEVPAYFMYHPYEYTIIRK